MEEANKYRNIGDVELRLCPLCGGVAKISECQSKPIPTQWTVRCPLCGCSVEGMNAEEATVRWNRRNTLSRDEKAKRLRRELDNLGSELMRMKRSGVYLRDGRRYTFKLCDDLIHMGKQNLELHLRHRRTSERIACIRKFATVIVNITKVRGELLRQLSVNRSRVKQIREELRTLMN